MLPLDQIEWVGIIRDLLVIFLLCVAPFLVYGMVRALFLHKKRQRPVTPQEASRSDSRLRF